MEDQTRFDLNAAIETWRNELAAQPNLASDDRRELEAHLRDAIAGFQQRGLNDAESFWLACHRVGQPQQLGEEFVKANPTKEWRFWAFWMILFLLINVLWKDSVDYLNCILTNTVDHHWHVYTNLIFTDCVGLFFQWLPILICAFLLSKGKLTVTNIKMPHFFQSPASLIFTAIVWISANCGMMILNDSLVSNNFTSWPTFWSILFQMITRPVLLLVLLVWLMPAQNRKTPKLA